MAELGAEFAITATDKTDAAFRSVQANLNRTDSAVQSFNASFGRIATAAGGIGAAVVAAGAALSVFTDTVSQLAKLDDAAESTGSSVENLSGALKALAPSGFGLDQLQDVTVKLVRAMSSADEETSKAALAFNKLGIQTRDSNGNLRDSVILLQELGEKLNGYADGSNKTAIAQAILGKTGAQYLPLLKDLGEAGELNGKITAEQAAQAEKLEKQWVILGQAGKELRTSIVSEIVPALASMIEQFNIARRAGLGLFEALNTVPGANASKQTQVDEQLKKLEKLRDARGALNNPDIVDLDERVFGSGRSRAQIADEKIFKEQYRLNVLRQQGGLDLVKQINSAPDDLREINRLTRKPIFEQAPGIPIDKKKTGGGNKTEDEEKRRAAAFLAETTSVKEYIAQQQLLADSFGPVLDGQKRAAKIEADLATGKLVLNKQQKLQIDQEIAAGLVLEKANKLRIEVAKQNEISRTQESAAIDAQRAVNEQAAKSLIESQNRIDEIGKESAALLILRDRRLAVAAASLRADAIDLENQDREGLASARSDQARGVELSRGAGFAEQAANIEAELKQRRESLQVYGLTETSVIAIRNAKIAEQLTTLEAYRAQLLQNDAYKDTVDQLDKVTKALKESADLNTREIAVKKAIDQQAELNGLLKQGLEDIFFSGAKATEVIKKLVLEFARLEFKKSVLDPIFNGTKGGGGGSGGFDITNIFGRLFGSGGGGGSLPGIDLGQFFADGGIMTKYGRASLNTYAGGGIADSPQVAIYGERGPEAYVPLPGNRKIPVQLGGQGGGGKVVINQSISVGDGVSLSQVRQAMDASRRETLAEISNQLRRGGPIRDGVRAA